MENNKTNSGWTEGLDKAMNVLDERASCIVGKIYNEALVEKIENFDLMKKLVASGFIKAINDFGKGWFKQVFIILGYIGIVMGAFTVLTSVVALLKSFSAHWYYLLFNLLTIVSGILYLIWWVGMVKFKKWYPFVVILNLWINIATIILSAFALKIIWGSNYYGGTISVAYGNMLFSIVIWIAVWSIWYALILKNKALFKN